MTDYRYFPDIFNDVMINVIETMTLIGIVPIYKSGSYAELVSSSSVDDLNQNQKYPLVWLVWDAGEDSETWIVGDVYQISPRIFILTTCVPDDSSLFCRETYIKPIIMPIFEAVYDEMFCHPNIEAAVDFTKKINEHPHWGETYNNKMFDNLSGIEVVFDKLIIKEH
jgi:hypothetical protein